ncbi:hypothetical protein B566_EDAN014983 [Ephemera danica]|nr:hypothetical protein B566_EDAN014983 [Ephemera danica]
MDEALLGPFLSVRPLGVQGNEVVDRDKMTGSPIRVSPPGPVPPPVSESGLNYLASFYLLSGHHNDSGVLLPNHMPKVSSGAWQAALSGDVVLFMAIREHLFFGLQANKIARLARSSCRTARHHPHRTCHPAHHRASTSNTVTHDTNTILGGSGSRQGSLTNLISIAGRCSFKENLAKTLKRPCEPTADSVR